MRLFCFILCLTFNSCYPQAIPDLTTGDHFLPSLSESQKQAFIIKCQRERVRLNTSEELYPHLYKYKRQNYLAPVTGTSADPNNAFRNNAITEYSKPSAYSSASESMYNNDHYQQQAIVDVEADIAAYEAQKKQNEQLLQDAYKTIGALINYHLGLHHGAAANRYAHAYSALQEMLEDNGKIDFLRAVWIVEGAIDPTITWEDFNSRFQNSLNIIVQLMRQQKISPNDNLGKLMSIYRFMTDTTHVYMNNMERTIVSKPLLYDFEDYEAKKDISKIFVSKLLRSGSGQCMSLPLLFYLYAKALHAEAYIAFAPQHSYITFKDNLGAWQNIELTAGMLTSTDFYWQSGFIKAEQVKSGIYLKPISEKETIAYLLTTLTLAYVRTFGTDELVLQMARSARESFPNSLTANMILAGYNMELWKHVQRQYAVYGLNEACLKADENAQRIKQNKEASLNHIYQNLGWAKMPEWAYQKWLSSVTVLANKKQHLVRKRQLEQQLSK